MKTSLKVLSWVQIVFGGLGIVGVISNDLENALGAFLMCGLLVATGIVALNYVSKTSKQ